MLVFVSFQKKQTPCLVLARVFNIVGKPMCAALELNSRMIRPGKLTAAWRNGIAEQLIWAGFARKETLGWWKRNGAELVDVPAHRFAERSERDRQLRWDDVPAGLVVRGIVVVETSTPLLKIVTRASTAEEIQRFEHPRMPLIEQPIFSAAPIESDPPTKSAQRELF